MSWWSTCSTKRARNPSWSFARHSLGRHHPGPRRLDRCLEHGGQYAWSVRALAGRAEVSEWSVTNLFDVTAGPTEAEFKEALQVVQEYLAAQTEAGSPGTGEDSLAEEQLPRGEGPSASSPIGACCAGTPEGIAG